MLPIIYLTPQLSLESYPFLLGIAWSLIFYLGKHQLRVSDVGEQGFISFYFICSIAAWLGAKIFFLLTTPLESVNSLIFNPFFWMGGGGVFYGALIFFFACSYILIQEVKIFTWKQLSKIIFLFPIGHAFGRLGCFFAGCCYGTPTSGWVGVNHLGIVRHPVQLYEVTLLVFLALVLYKIHNKFKPKMVIFGYPFIYAIMRFFLEFWRGDRERGVWDFGSFAQITSIMIVLFIIIFFGKLKKE